MNTIDTAECQELSYRLVYARLNSRSEEGVVVGLIYQTTGPVKSKFVSSQRLYQKLPKLVDIELTEQIEYSIKIFKEQIDTEGNRLGEMGPSTSMIRLGKRFIGVCDDEDCFVTDILKCSSSLFSHYTLSVRTSYESIGQKEIEDAIKSELVRLNPFQAKRLLGSRKRIRLDKKSIEIPFFGERMIGAPVSMRRIDPYYALGNAEHWLVRLSYARKVLQSEGLERTPRLYLYVPKEASSRRARKADDVASEIELVGDSVNVLVTKASSVDRLAEALYRDEQILWH